MSITTGQDLKPLGRCCSNKFESVLNPSAKEKVTINYDGKTYKYRVETSNLSNENLSSFLVVEGEEKPVEE